MNNTYDAFITLAKSSNINMDSLFSYYMAKEANAEVKAVAEEAKAEEANAEVKAEAKAEAKEANAEVKAEAKAEVKAEAKAEVKKVGPEKSWIGFACLGKKKSWADYEDEEDDRQEKLEMGKKAKEAAGMSKVNDTRSYKEIVSPLSTDVVSTSVEASSDEWESVQYEGEFVSVSKKKSFKNNLDVIYTLEQFINCIKDKKKPNFDFIIHDDAHCPHTFEGSLCKDVRRCKKIHIQRCTAGERCKSKNCPFLHIFDMCNDAAKKTFTDTMSLYNKIKPKKQVKYNE